MQKQYCREFAESQGWTIIKEFAEKGVSGFKVAAADRDAIQEIRQDAEERKFDILLVFMFDRLGRRDDETPFIVEWFTKQGIEVCSAHWWSKQKMHWKPWKSSSCRHRKNTKKPPKQQSVATTSATSCLHGRMFTTPPTTMNAAPFCSSSLRRFASEKTMRSRLR